MSNTTLRNNKTYSISVHYHENVVAEYSNRKSKLFDTRHSEEYDSLIVSLTEREVHDDGTITYRPRETQFVAVPIIGLNDVKLRSTHEKYALYLAEKTSDTRCNYKLHSYRTCHKIYQQILNEVLDYALDGEELGLYRPWSV